MTPKDAQALAERHQRLKRQIGDIEGAMLRLKEKNSESGFGPGAEYFDDSYQAVVCGVSLPISNHDAGRYLARELDLARAHARSIEAAFATLKAPV